jgi:hypothetical protein
LAAQSPECDEFSQEKTMAITDTAFLLFPNFTTPDLGCLVRRKHGLEVEPGSANIHVEFMPSIELQPRFHQTYFRVKCGHAAFFQRCLVFKTRDLSIPGPILQNFPPDFVLGGDRTPGPSDWQHYPVSSGPSVYWFIGQHRNPAQAQWRPDAITGHVFDIYENGTLSTVHYDDTGGDGDMNDFILEVAIVVRRRLLDTITQTLGQAQANAKFTKGAATRFSAEFEKAKKKKPTD